MGSLLGEWMLKIKIRVYVDAPTAMNLLFTKQLKSCLIAGASTVSRRC
jgi:hypothetical protein